LKALQEGREEGKYWWVLVKIGPDSLLTRLSYSGTSIGVLRWERLLFIVAVDTLMLRGEEKERRRKVRIYCHPNLSS